MTLQKNYARSCNVGRQLITLDETEINGKIITHFQKFAGLTETNIPIPESWTTDYEPLPFIEDDIYKDQLIYISLQELNVVLITCSNGKAVRNSMITYEMVKHSSKVFKQKLLILYNMCLDVGLSPNKWKHALLFPTPKPHLMLWKFVKIRI